jgi:alpha-N-acetylglucosaminidase
MARLLSKGAANKFKLSLLPADPNDHHPTFEVRASQPDAPEVAGTTGVAIASGVYFYLKQYCGCSVTWGAGQNGTAGVTWGVDQLDLPLVLPAVAITQRHRAATRFSWAFNVVGFSYSSVWWDWARWERELDFMALHGVNLALAFIGQEQLWNRMYEQLGLSAAQIDAYFSGPAYLSWERMGNLQLFAGPLPASWRQEQFALQKKILQRMVSLGVEPVLPCFAGIGLPNATASLFPNASWGHLPDYAGLPANSTGNLLLSALDPLYPELAAKWVRILALRPAHSAEQRHLGRRLPPPLRLPAPLRLRSAGGALARRAGRRRRRDSDLRYENVRKVYRRCRNET